MTEMPTQVLPWLVVPPLSPAQFEEVRMQTIFDCCKWDPQFGDVSVLADFPILLTHQAWATLTSMAEQLAAETIAVETELLGRPDLLQKLNLPRAIVAQWKRPQQRLTAHSDVRLIRFDFHYTTDGWRISEANADTPSGFIEASCFTQLMAQHYGAATLTGDPAAALAQAICESVGEGAMVALVHATAYSDDRQVMIYIAKHLERAGLKTCLVSPAHLNWDNAHVTIKSDFINTDVDFIVRFFPTEWLPDMPRATGWRYFFYDHRCPACNPTSSLIVQSKRFPLLWDVIQTPIPTWRTLLPETRDPRQITGKYEDWVFKPMFGRAGENVGIPGVTPPADLEIIQSAVKKHPQEWIAQRRFETIPFELSGRRWYPCIGVYTINGKVAGAYGRAGAQPITDAIARDTAVLLAPTGSA